MEILEIHEERPQRILLVEDSELDRSWLRLNLMNSSIDILEAQDGIEGISLCQSQNPDLVLLDLGLPYCDGFEVLRRLKEDRRTSAIPVIVVSAETTTQDKVRGLDMGAVDYVTKPYDLFELRARIRLALRTKRIQDMLEQRAHVDGLTGLSNRLALEERISIDWQLHQRHGGALSVLIADLDHFKKVNDTHGHPAGDEVLRQAAAILRGSVRTSDMAARYGGEEFVVIAPKCDLAGAFKTAERFRSRLADARIALEGAKISITVSIGIASSPEDGATSAEGLLATADKALYQAKCLGRNMSMAWSESGPKATSLFQKPSLMQA